MSSNSPAGIQVTDMARRLLCRACTSKRGSRAPPAPAPGAPALGALTYADLHDRASRAAGALRERGAAPGERVAIALPAGEDFAVALHACLLLGAAAVPVDLRAPTRRPAGAQIVVDAPVPTTGAPIEGGVVHDLDAPAIVVHTSGTTADPTPVELTYGNWLWSALGSAAALGSADHDRWLCTLPLVHVGGLSILVRSAIYATAAIVHESWDTERALGEIEDRRDARLRRPDNAAPAARRRPAATRRPCAVRCSAARRARPTCSPPRPTRASRSPRPTA